MISAITQELLPFTPPTQISYRLYYYYSRIITIYTPNPDCSYAIA